MTRPGPGAAGGAGFGPEDAAESLTARTVTGFKWAFVTAAGQSLLSLAILMLLSRLLTPGDFGRLAIPLIFLALADAAGNRTIGSALVQRFALDRRHVATALALSLLNGVAMAATLWALAPVIGRLLGAPAMVPVIEALSPACFLAGLGAVSEHLLRRRLRFGRLLVASVLSQALGNGLVAVAMALLGYGVWALVWGALARHALFALAVIVFEPPPLPRFGRREAADLVLAGGGFSAVSLINVAARQGVNLLVARALGAASLGFYTRAEALALVPARLSPVLHNVFVPAMARRQHRSERLEAVHLHGVEALSLLALPAGVAIALSAPEVVALVLGGQWDEAVPVLRVLAPASMLAACNAVHVSVIRAMGAAWRETRRRALYLAVLTAGVWWGSRWGLAGVAAAVAGAWLVLHLLLSQLTLSLLGLSWGHLLRRHRPALWGGLCAAAALWPAAALVRAAALPAVAALPLELAAGAAAAAAAAYWAPPCARPGFARWALERLPLSDMGRTGRRLGMVLAHLARRWQAP